jgi:ABC-type glycerol-3-phosphate transport system substrate-binding protein
MNSIRMRIRRTMSAAVVSALGLAATTYQALAQDVTLSFHHFLPPMASAPQNVQPPWMRQVD